MDGNLSEGQEIIFDTYCHQTKQHSFRPNSIKRYDLLV